MIKINCRICNKLIENPKFDQVTCSKRCAKENKEMIGVKWRNQPKIKARLKKYNKNYYLKNKKKLIK